MADHAPPFEVSPGHEPGGVDDGQQRQVERVTEGDETGALLGSGDVQGARHGLRLVGQHPDRLASHAHQCRHELGRPPRPQFDEVAIICDRSDHPAHVVAARRHRRDNVSKLGRGARSRVLRYRGRRKLIAVRRKETEQLVNDLERALFVARQQRGKAGAGGVHGCPP